MTERIENRQEATPEIPGQGTLPGTELLAEQGISAQTHPFAEHVDGATSPVAQAPNLRLVGAEEPQDPYLKQQLQEEDEVRSGRRRAVIMSMAGTVIATGVTAYFAYQRIRRHPGHNQD